MTKLIENECKKRILLILAKTLLILRFMIQSLQNWKILTYLIIVFTFVGCSTDSPNENPQEQTMEICEIENPDTGCESVTLQGTTGWVKVLKQGDLADPLFLYPVGDKSEPYGTVTVRLENRSPIVKINDAVLDDYLIRTSQNSDGSNAYCKSGMNIETIETGYDSPSTVKISANYDFPFYIKLEANVCF